MGAIFDILKLWDNKEIESTEADDSVEDIDTSRLDAYRGPCLDYVSNSTDAIISDDRPRHNGLFTRSELHKISTSLMPFEMISLLFLLLDDNDNVALDIMFDTTFNSSKFVDFLLDYTISSNAMKKLIEALCIIQNYAALVEFGYEKSNLLSDYLPLNNRVQVRIDKVRKCCYRLMEQLTPEKECELLQLITKDLRETKDCFMSSYKYMEMNLAYLFHIKYITSDNLSNLLKHFKFLGPQLNQDAHNIFYGMPSTGPAISGQGNKIYPMDSNNPGIVVIIENINFYEDPYNMDLVIKTEYALSERNGSTKDSKRLADIFTRFGFKIIHKLNQTHQQMIGLVTDIAHNMIQINHSSLILIMLSHGQNNQIIGCNSVPVDMDIIKQKINTSVLEDKPKILINQACQGSQVLKIESADLRTDGPTNLKFSKYPWQKHIFEYWAAVADTVSFRDPMKGTWMIQELCDVLEEASIPSFADICTEVNRRLGNKIASFHNNEKNIMIPQYRSTLGQQFVLPPLMPKC